MQFWKPTTGFLVAQYVRVEDFRVAKSGVVRELLPVSSRQKDIDFSMRIQDPMKLVSCHHLINSVDDQRSDRRTALDVLLIFHSSAQRGKNDGSI